MFLYILHKIYNIKIYIQIKIWLKSDDENLEMLVDAAIDKILTLDLWNDLSFVRNIYNFENTYKIAVQDMSRTAELLTFFEDFRKTDCQLHTHWMFVSHGDTKTNRSMASKMIPVLVGRTVHVLNACA